LIRSGSTGCSTASPPYHFITAIEGCAQIAHHIIASEGWRVAESNADAVRAPGVQRVVPGPTAEAVARAVGSTTYWSTNTPTATTGGCATTSSLRVSPGLATRRA